MAQAKYPYVFSDNIVLQAETTRRTRNGKVSHLFVTYTNGGISGFPVSFCNIIDSFKGDWQSSGNEIPLCNRCGREFRKHKKSWVGEP